MGGAYTATAVLYDDFRGESPNMWAAYLDELFVKYGEKKPRTLIDLACGTGSVTAALCRLGYDVTGVDISEEMLALAQRRAPAALLLHQDMRSLDLYGTYGGAVCCLDSVNYLPSYDDFKRTLSRLHNFLDPGALFIFDINTEKRFREKYGKNDFILESKNGLIAWSCDYKPRLKKCDFYLSCFIPDGDGKYIRRDEEQTEYVYKDAEIRRLSEETGYETVAALDRISFQPANENSEKVHYIFKRI